MNGACVVYRDPICSEFDIVLYRDSSHKPLQNQLEIDPKDNLMHLKIKHRPILSKKHPNFEYFFKLRFTLSE
jgi:hypothetical protein